MGENLLEVQNLKKYFPITAGVLRRTVGHVKAVDDISFTVKPGETLGLVGESGCGKSTTGRMVMRVLEPTEGRIVFDGEDITKMSGGQLRRVRPKFQMVFQDPYASLNPKMAVEEIIAEPMIVNQAASRRQAIERVVHLLETVGLRGDDRLRYPHEFSGGQRQRIGIARALALNPKLIVADEAVSALDVSIQSQILNLMVDLKKEFNLSYIFISHNLAVVRHISDRVAVMYLGHMVEVCEKTELYNNPLHPYTVALLSAAPEPKREGRRERIILQGDVPSPANPPKGCPFHTRCPKVMDVCRSQRPSLREIAPGHFTACHLY
ncbi:ABC transporter ATP-binding protein [Alicyclobacillus mengziensis]|uniref:Dipeptide ABC transporter ATP-binding protein n=1 Tax=Alicyclobacillus mengziensis TaxID=2931921 RepID=A0A9X7VWM6_9BACL|nr:dipeptide ABC transporter ATP-binding protein [Alicyclobacillus mengziensis]QSO46438.1 dipeptide ABC transporter ATP-binding protein [Alicyclobacillus mengziensis]